MRTETAGTVATRMRTETVRMEELMSERVNMGEKKIPALILLDGRRVLVGRYRAVCEATPATARCSTAYVQSEPGLYVIPGSSAGYVLPLFGMVEAHRPLKMQPVESLSEANTVVADAEDAEAVLLVISEACPEVAWEFADLRELLSDMDETGYGLIARAASLQHWNRQTQFCGACGSHNDVKTDEVAKKCPVCGNVTYPRISPAIIVAVRRGNRLLLAHARHFTEGMYSLVAGFVEPGEMLEHAVAREVMEETGIRVKNIRYWGSQPWPFTDSLMTGFTAEYESGDVTPDGVEITDADWFGSDGWPNIPTTVSIAGRIIRRIQADLEENEQTVD